MPSQKLLIASFEEGLQTNKPQFLLDNQAFPVIENMYVWRKRILKKRGTELIGRLQRALTAQALGNTDGGGAFSGNVRTILTLQSNASFVPGTISITVGAQVFTDNSLGVLSNGIGGTGTVNYSTMAITLQTAPVLAATPVTITFEYYPDLPVMGLEDFINNSTITSAINFPTLVAFDQVYAYQFDYGLRKFYDVSFYKMDLPPFSPPPNPITWSGLDYQQFFSLNYQNAMFVTNNVAGFHFKVITAITKAANAQITIVGHGLQVNSVIWINEVQGMTAINEMTATVVSIVDANNVTVNIDTLPGTYGAYTGGGIAQYLTNSVAGLGDGIRWYDGFGANLGFVNFAPPLQKFDAALLPNPSYLVGALFFAVYQGQMMAFGTFEKTSIGTLQYHRNRVRWSQLGTVYYATLTPIGQTSDPLAWIDNIPGRGGFRDFDTNEKIIEASINQEILIVGLESTKRKIVGTNDNLQPFIFQTISPEFGSESTFASIPLDRGVLSVGDYGFIITTSYDAKRFDLEIPDLVFQIDNSNHGNERVSAIRDFRNEFIYFTFPSFENKSSNFPNRTLLFNYRENNFAVFREQYTTYGGFREQSGVTWASLNANTWASYSWTWDSGQDAGRFPNIAGGNQQGFVLKKDVGTFPAPSHYIQNITAVVGSGESTITSPSHGMIVGEYILISDCIGSTNLNGLVVLVAKEVTTNTFKIDKEATGTYFGGGRFTVLDNVNLQSKQFPINWENALGVRIGKQQFLFDTTTNGECTVNIFTSQNPNTPVNDASSSPFLVASNIVRTRPDESLGLHDASNQQLQTWHRTSNSFTGNTVQFSLTYSDSQMRSLAIQRSDLVLYAIEVEFYPSSVLP